jgi:hypothetical protein
VFVRVAFVTVASDKLAVPAAIVAVAIVVVPDTRFAIFALVAVALVMVAADKLAVPAAIVAVAIVVVAKLAVPVAEILFSAKFPVEVALVIVAFSAVKPRTESVFAHRVFSTFKNEILDVEIVVVPRVVVPAVRVPAFVLAETVFVRVAFVIVASDKLAEPAAIVVVAREVVPVFVNTPVVVEYVRVLAEIRLPSPSVSCTVNTEPVAVLAPTADQSETPEPLAMYKRPEAVSIARDPVAVEAIPTGVPEAMKKLAVLFPCDKANTEVVVEVVATVRTELATWLVPIPTFVVEVAMKNLSMPLVINESADCEREPILNVWIEDRIVLPPTATTVS